MASQVINNFEGELPKPFMLRDILPGPAWAPYQSHCRFLSAEFESQDEEAGSCVKGSLVAIGLEGAAAIAVYALWLLWHMIR